MCRLFVPVVGIGLFEDGGGDRVAPAFTFSLSGRPFFPFFRNGAEGRFLACSGLRWGGYGPASGSCRRRDWRTRGRRMATALMGLMGLVGRRIRRADGLGRGRFLDRPSRGGFEDGAGSEGMNGADSFGPRHSTSARGGLGRAGVPASVRDGLNRPAVVPCGSAWLSPMSRRLWVVIRVGDGHRGGSLRRGGRASRKNVS